MLKFSLDRSKPQRTHVFGTKPTPEERHSRTYDVDPSDTRRKLNMTKLEEARKQRMEAMESFRTNVDLKEKILNGILQVLDYRTNKDEFDPVKIIFMADFQPNHLTHNDVWIDCRYLRYHYYEHEICIDFGKRIESLRWYASIIHEYLSEQKELVVSELCQSEEEDCTSFTVNFSEE